MQDEEGNVNVQGGQKPRKLLDRVRVILPPRHYSIHTEEAHIGRITRYILCHNKRHSNDMGSPEIETFLTLPAVDGKVSASTQNQAFNAILFLCRNVLDISLEGERINALRARRKRSFPVVMTREEVRRVITLMTGQCQLMAKFLYRSGIRLMECIRLRTQDLDFGRNELTVRNGKVEKDRLARSCEK